MKTVSKMLLGLIATAGIPVLASAAGHGHTTQAAATNATMTKAAVQPQSDGEIKKVDREAGKMTIKHGPLVNLDMPAMTMVFTVKEPAMLEQVKAGDKVKFAVEKINGRFTITALQAAM